MNTQSPVVAKFYRLLPMILTLFGMLSTAIAQPALGRQRFAMVDSLPLKATVSSTPGFYMKVGGVAFSDSAIGEDGLVVTGLRYQPSNTDGQRLIVDVKHRDGKKQSIVAPIFDWELIPIARYAQSDYNSAFTIFGSGEDVKDDDDREDVDSIIEVGGRLVQYHEAFENELMGLRMFQADILLLTEDSADLFSEAGKKILGRGESSPDISKNLRHLNHVQNSIQQVVGAGLHEEVWTTPRAGAQQKVWKFNVSPGTGMMFKAFSLDRDIDLDLMIDGVSIDSDYALDSEPEVGVAGLYGEIDLKLLIPEGTRFGEGVYLSWETFGYTERIINADSNGSSRKRWAFHADPNVAYQISAESEAMRDIDLVVTKNGTVIAEDKYVDPNPFVQFGDAQGRVQVELIFPSGSSVGDSVQIYESAHNNAGYQSYVITDPSKRDPTAKVRFSIQNDQLQLSGYPYWQMWSHSFRYQNAVLAVMMEAYATNAEPLEPEIENDDIIIKHKLSADVSDWIREQDGINPAVYDALCTTLRFSALFRHAKERDPVGYGVFVTSLEKVSTRPVQPKSMRAVATPNIWLPQSE